ncbi:MAG: HisA/HisF-related TIM barrel protein, partial [Kiritimatiellaceae bacterium]|nr:HisA/HisF-related TIM barrel protein [Kiritimatiellaceae bacterium]
ETTDVVAVDLAKQVDAAGVGTIIYTDTSRDGMMDGVNAFEMGKICSAVKCDVVASGGVSSLDDIKRLAALNCDNLTGAIVGKALYEETVSVKQLKKAAQ